MSDLISRGDLLKKKVRKYTGTDWQDEPVYEEFVRVRDIKLAPAVTPEAQWISVKDRLPERGEFVLFFYTKNCRNPTQHAKNTMAVGRYDYGMFLVEGCSVSVTHWMPLQEPPEVGGADYK